MSEYPKALTAIITAIILAAVRYYFPDFINEGLESQIYTAVFGVVIFLAGRYFRLSKTDAETLDKIKNPY